MKQQRFKEVKIDEYVQKMLPRFVRPGVIPPVNDWGTLLAGGR